MFAPPPQEQARLFAKLPEEFCLKGRSSAWLFGKRNKDIGSFLEGPVLEADGSLLVADIPFGRIFRLTMDRKFHCIAEYEGEPNGLALDRNGRLWIADHRKGLLSFNRDTGKIRTELGRLRRQGFMGLNDVQFHSNGTLFFTDQGQTGMHDASGKLYARRPDGRVELLVDTIPSPNGMALSPDERTLYVAVTRANQVWRVPLHEDGSTTKVNIFLQLSGGYTGPDGLATDEAGNVYVCHCGMGCVWVFDEMGWPKRRIDVPDGLDVTAACFGGPDMKTLFILESSRGAVYTVDCPAAGNPTFAQGALEGS
ncbi:SMP-30/gluconolactonase/LRE family protein [Roseibium sediminicola]|uniref:SMP-30/gluconolactonase/LRE family protein n=1 Tax=Roseibium sediminicola TaxID=2933272 RepID=A0ABT0H3B3_9HYPH|nr:SMP-30/gluconolactonase/LRE family protein [Roseibium sp. CAU 1639]MCK7616173.1 SMP-30/gluconolactonase/LRE family protein [Roseibium sp. CAU 1639]